MYCPNCNKQIEDGSRFCEYCGANFATTSYTAPSSVQPQPAYIPPKQPQPQGYYQPQPVVNQQRNTPKLKGLAITLFIVGGVETFLGLYYAFGDFGIFEVINDFGWAFLCAAATSIIAGIGLLKLNNYFSSLS